MRLTVFYDEGCAFCCRCRDWLRAQPTFVPVELVGGAPPRPGELVVQADDGRVWTGLAAFTMCPWATKRYRSLSYTVTGPAAEAFFRNVSAHRERLAAMLG